MFGAEYMHGNIGCFYLTKKSAVVYVQFFRNEHTFITHLILLLLRDNFLNIVDEESETKQQHQQKQSNKNIPHHF